MIIMNIVKVLISIGAVSLLCFLTNLSNAKKSRRIRQFPMVLLAIAFMIVGIILWSIYVPAINPILSRFSFFFSFNLLLGNLILMIGFLGIKEIVRPIVTSIFKRNALLKAFAFSFYVYDEEYDEWFLRKKWINFRKFCLSILIGMVLASGFYLGLTWVFGSSSNIWMYIYPCTAIIVFGEFYGYINGHTKEEYEHEIQADAVDARRVSNYYKLREVLEELLPDPLLAAHTGCEFLRRDTPADAIKALKESESTEDILTAEFFDIKD